MIFTIAGIDTNLKLSSIILEPNYENPGQLLLYHCWKCGKPLFQFNANVVAIMPGGTFTRIPIVEHCKYCKHRYLVNSIL